MKFSDIKKFTRRASYAVDIPLEYVKKTIDNYINECNLIMEPDFQRGHVWTKKQKIAYVEYFLRGGLSGKDIYFNHPNWHYNARSNYNEFVLVDGLQRLTALLDFLNDKFKVFGYYYSEYQGYPSLEHSLRFHINDLKSRSEVLNWYLEMNTGGTVHSKKEIDRVTNLYQEAINEERIYNEN